ncbi:MAG: hypothetical protein KDK70_34235 [Myxococcales bacterium]|nr:hypothetical protein [Myxococcales bacterium]
MASQAVRRLLELHPTPDPAHVVATLELQCGCRVTRTLPEDRIVERPGGERFAVGKIPCPQGHPVRPPSG